MIVVGAADIFYTMTGFSGLPMEPVDVERWRRLRPILDRALELPAAERPSWLDSACAGDPAIRSDIEQLLEEDATTGGILDSDPNPLLQLALEDGDPGHNGGGRFIPGVILAGRYRVINLLGRGGMGEIYRADDLKLGQPVALKFLSGRLTQDPALLASLLREARITRQVSHPNVCRVYDIGEAEGHTFLTMEYIDGEDLRSLLRRIGQLPHAKALDIARQLCAGLQAAHDLGVLHRDLKPSNVMLDARGRARITDFGIAAVAGEGPSSENLAGTPAYMAPEQLDGRATARSDVYALGLVMLELFTGERAFQVASLDDLRRLHESSAVTRPSTLVAAAALEPRVGRAILACLESDPELRPRSGRAVMALLPGGDPIEAASEAGETPSPDLVAASGPEGSLSPRVAFGTFAAAVAMLTVLVLLADRASVLGWVQVPLGADVLEDRARGMLERLGFTVRAGDRAIAFGAANDRYRRYVRAHDTSPERWNVLREPGQWDRLFWYRQAPDVLMPWNPDGRVLYDDPAPTAGDVQVITDLRGRLLWLVAHPDEAEPPGAAVRTPEWGRLFQEAGLDAARFTAVEPTRNPGVTADVRAAWAGVVSEAGGYPVRVEAAAHRGQLVYFEHVVPWDPYWDPSSAPQAAPALNRSATVMFRVLAAIGLIAAPLATLALVARNWMNGRGDRAGAFRVAALVFTLRLATWLLDAHHVPHLRQEWILFTIGLGKSLVDAAAGWALYLAVEPYARRLHPRFLVSWTRLLRGRVSDPLVGRDLLFGIALSAVTILTSAQLPVILPHVLGQPSPPAPMFHPLGNLPFLYVLNAPPPQPLLGARHVLASLSAVALTTLGIGLVFLVLLLTLNIVLRRFWLALVVYAVIMVAANPIAEASGYTPISVAASLMATLTFVVALRFGLVGTLAHWFGAMLWMNFPVTAKLDAPFFGAGLFGVATLAALAGYGAVVAARRGRRSLATIR